MSRATRLFGTLGIGLLLLATAACSSSSDSILGDDDVGTLMAVFGLEGDEAIQEGLSVGAAPRVIELDPCDPEAPIDLDSGALLGETMLGAFVIDADLLPVVAAEVTFATSAGELASMGQPVLTDERGLATDTLFVDQGDVGQVVITVTTPDFEETLELPVALLDKLPVTLEMDPGQLWPPNHKLREVNSFFPGLQCYREASVVLISVTSNEPDNGTGDGDTDDDIQSAGLGTDDTELLLRAERSGSGDGRVYTIVYDVTLEEGETVSLSTTVTVPHDQGH